MSTEKLSHILNPKLLEKLVEVPPDDAEESSVAYSNAVFMTPQTHKRFMTAQVNSRARCFALMRIYTQEGGENLSVDKFRSEGWFSTGGQRGRKVQIFAFKAHQLRVYGARIPDTNCFICTEIEVAKQKQGADQNKLKRAAKKIGQFI